MKIEAVIPNLRLVDISLMRQWGAFVPVCLLLSCSAPPPARDERQITSGIGVARSPVLSRDGAVVAIAASPDDHCNSQIWVRRVEGVTPPLRLTDDASQNYDPEFSPDGKSVYFTSMRSPQGIYRVSVSGGAPELVIEDAVAAKVSPAHILVTAKNRDEAEPEWWITDITGRESHKTSIMEDLRQQGFNSASANAWLAGDWIVFTGLRGETQTLWKVQIDPNSKVLGQAVRATNDAEGDYGASFVAGKLVFARTRVDMNLWALPLDSTGERLAGPPQPLTSSPIRKGQESAAGTKLLYSAENGDRFSLFLKDRGEERLLRDAFFSVLTPDGRHYAYGEGTTDRLTVLMKSVGWWPFWSSTLCENCGMPRGFTPDGRKLLLWSNSPPIHHLDMLDLATHQVKRIVWAGDDLSGPHLSPDGRWVSFVAKMGKHQWQTFAAPVGEEKLLGSFDWVPITPVSDSFHFAFWSASGDLLYILTAHGGSGNLRWLVAQRLDVETKRPIGGAVPVYEFDEMLVPGMDPIWNTVAVAGDRIILELGGVSTNIWIK